MSQTNRKSAKAPAQLDPSIYALATLAAERLSVPVADWIESRLRACLIADLADDLGALPGKVRPHMHRWIQRRVQHPIGTLPTGEDLCELFGVAASAGASQDASTGRKVRLYDDQAMQRALVRVTEKEHRAHFSAAMRFGPERAVPTCGSRQVRRVENLRRRAPHLAEATEAVLGALAVARRTKGRLRMLPILLSGPAAAWKTWWAREMAVALGLPVASIAMPQVTASFVLAGSSMSWSQGRPGRIVETYMQHDCASPIFILDEVDRLSEGSYKPEPMLLNLLERESARQWRDEYFEVEFDVSHAIFVATANHPERIDPALRSRFREIPVKSPGGDARPPVIASAWELHRSHYPELRLPEQLEGEVVAALAKSAANLRDLQRLFDNAIGRAARRPGRLRLLPADFGARAAALVPSDDKFRRTDKD